MQSAERVIYSRLANFSKNNVPPSMVWPTTFLSAILRILAPQCPWQHGVERVVAAPEMVIERRRGVKRNHAEEKESDRLVQRQELFRKRAVPTDQRWQLAEEKQIHPIAVGVGMQEPQDRLG